MENSDTAGQIYTQFLQFLKDHETVDKDSITHTCVGIISNLSGKFSIPSTDISIFRQLYVDAYELGYRFNLSEKQMDVGPLMTDYDFEFGSQYLKRMYNITLIRNIVQHLNQIIKEYIEVDTDDIIAYVTEKDEPTITRIYDGDNCSSSSIKKVKDGFHISYILPLTKEQRYLIYDKLKNTLLSNNVFSDIPYQNSSDTIIDISTIHRNNWMVYGCRKTCQRPYGIPYKLTHIFDYYMNEEEIEAYTFGDIVEKLSVRQFTSENKLRTIEEKKTEESQICEKYKLNGSSSRGYLDGRTSQSINHPAPPCNQMIYSGQNIPINSSETIDMAKKLVPLFSDKRACDRNEWIHVCWALHNISETLFDTFIEFSKRGQNKFDYNGCLQTWRSTKPNKYTIATLHLWARQDNNDEYRKLIMNSVDPKMFNIEAGKSVDFAILIQQLYQHRFACVKVDTASHSGWYEFDEHRWIHMDAASTLRNEISNHLAQKYINMRTAYLDKMKKEDDTDMDYYAAKVKYLSKICAQLRNTSPLNSIITECEHKFIDKKSTFMKSLDENRYLIGFENGVYDLVEGVFRNGLPEDYITFTTRYNWVNYNGDEPVFSELQEYFEKVMPNPNIREYLLRQIASFTRGVNSDQQFVFWTGSGCHSADTQILMYDGTSKRADEVQIGDNLMGDDSTPRKVLGLYNGVQQMYRITLTDGTTYIGNANHRMALKSIYSGEIQEIRFDDAITAYLVIIHKYNGFYPIKCEKYFSVRSGVSAVSAREMAQQYMQHRMKKASTIRMGNVVPVKIMDYLKMDADIKKFYRHYKNAVEFVPQVVTIDPYKLGSTLTTTMIPSQYKFNSMQIRRKIIAGILDRHGQIENDHINLSFHNQQFMNDCISLFRSIGLHVDITNIGQNKIILMGRFDEIPVQILKISNMKSHMEHDLTYEFAVDSIGKGQFYGFSVDCNERYILHNYIVTYNSNGKSLLMDLIKYTFGDYYKTMDPTILTRKRMSSSNATPELADKNGVRIIFMSEPEEDDKIYSSNMKKYTSGLDEICARPLYGPEFQYTPHFKMVMVCNELPDIYGKDNGTWRRIRVVPFEAEFVDGEPVKKNQFKKEKKLDEKIKTWCSAFIWLLVKKYYPVYCAEGLSEPIEVQIKTYKYRNDNDFYNEFIESRYEKTDDDSDKMSCNVFYNDFKAWFAMEYSKEKCPQKRTFLGNMERTGKCRCEKSYVYGLRLRQDDFATL